MPLLNLLAEELCLAGTIWRAGLYRGKGLQKGPAMLK
jgi:hypothetical protein